MKLDQRETDALNRILRIVRNEYVVHPNDLPSAVLDRVEELIRNANAPLDMHANAVVAASMMIKKIAMIKELRDRTQCGLNDGKAAIEDALLLWLDTELTNARNIITAREESAKKAAQAAWEGMPT